MIGVLDSIRRGRRARRARRAGTPPPAPFVVGVGRSGTTLLRLMLDAHPELAIPPETHFVPDLISTARHGGGAPELMAVLGTTRRWRDLGLDDEEMLRRFELVGTGDPTAAVRAVFGLYAERHGKTRWGDKTPRYSLIMEELVDVLPEARFVHLIRDGRDVALSRARMVSSRPEPSPPPPPGRVARRWRERIEDARRQARRLPHYLEVRYEDLVADTEPVLRRICDFAELDYDARMLRYHESSGERLREMERELPAKESGRAPVPGGQRMRVHALATEPPRADAVLRWRSAMPPEQVRRFERAAGDLLADLGYPVGEEHP